MSGQIITRTGGTAELVYGPATSQPRRTVQRARTDTPPAEYTYRDVELIEHFVDFTVNLGSGARGTIIEEIKRVQRDIGEVECGGWLLAQQRPRASSTFITIAYATGPLPGSRASRRSVELGDPIEAALAVRAAGLGAPWVVVGDWHAHCHRGSDLPSMQDARAWAGTMDGLAREAYVSLIVSPAPELGWMVPLFSAWVAGRDYTRGLPSRPVVGRARLA